MGNMTINGGVWSDAATLTASNELGTAPGTNLQNVQPGILWRTTDLSSIFLELDLFPAVPWSQVGLLYTNATAVASWRIRAADSQANLTAAPSHDSTTITLWASPDLEKWPRRHGLYTPGVTVTERWLRIDITDAANPAGFFEAGRLMVEAMFQPVRNYQYPARFGFVDSSIVRRTLGQQLFVRPLQARYVNEFSLPWLTESEALTSLTDIQITFGSQQPVLVALDPDTVARRHALMTYGLMIAQGAPLHSTSFQLYRQQFQIEEMG